MGTPSVESQIERLTHCIERCLTLRALLATGSQPDYTAILNAWNALLDTAELCGALAAALREKREGGAHGTRP